MNPKEIEILDGYISRIKESEKHSFRRTLAYLVLPVITGGILIACSVKVLQSTNSQIYGLKSQLTESDTRINDLQAKLAETQRQLNAYQKPIVLITQAPPSGGGSDSMFMISGEVKGVNPEEYHVVVYAYVDKWYVQPNASGPVTSIEPDGKWMTDTHGGKKYAALLIKRNFVPPTIYSTLPIVGENVVSVSVVSASE